MLSLQESERVQLATFCSASIEHDADTALIRLEGEFDLSCEDRFHAEVARITAWRPDTVVLDLRGLTFIDSRGLRMVLELDGASRQRGFELTLVQADGQVQRVLSITGLDRLLSLDRPLHGLKEEPAR